jgi:hypothetical protein
MTQHGEGTAADQRTERNPVATLEFIKRNAQVASLEMGVLEHGASTDSAVARLRRPARLDRVRSSRALGV